MVDTLHHRALCVDSCLIHTTANTQIGFPGVGWHQHRATPSIVIRLGALTSAPLPCRPPLTKLDEMLPVVPLARLFNDRIFHQNTIRKSMCNLKLHRKSDRDTRYSAAGRQVGLKHKKRKSSVKRKKHISIFPASKQKKYCVQWGGSNRAATWQWQVVTSRYMRRIRYCYCLLMSVYCSNMSRLSRKSLIRAERNELTHWIGQSAGI